MHKFKKVLIISFLIFVPGLIFALYYLRPSSVIGRILIYENTIQIIEDNFIFGIGPGKFGSIYPSYQADYLFKHPLAKVKQEMADNTTVGFNEYLQFIAETGVLGFALCLFSLYLLFRVLHNVFKTESFNLTDGVVVSVICLSIIAIFSYPFRNLVTLTFICILISLVNSRLFIIWKFKITEPYKKIILRTSMLSITFIALLHLVLQTFSQIKWKILIESNVEFEDKIIKYDLLSHQLNSYAPFLYNYGTELSLNKKFEKSIPVLNNARKHILNTDLLIYLGDSYLATHEYDKAEKNYLKAVYLVPKKFLPKYALMQFYESRNDKRSADSVAKKILNEKVVYPSKEVNIIKYQAQQLLDQP